jgi:hypothetical protein
VGTRTVRSLGHAVSGSLRHGSAHARPRTGREGHDGYERDVVERREPRPATLAPAPSYLRARAETSRSAAQPSTSPAALDVEPVGRHDGPEALGQRPVTITGTAATGLACQAADGRPSARAADHRPDGVRVRSASGADRGPCASERARRRTFGELPERRRLAHRRRDSRRTRKLRTRAAAVAPVWAAPAMPRFEVSEAPPPPRHPGADDYRRPQGWRVSPGPDGRGTPPHRPILAHRPRLRPCAGRRAGADHLGGDPACAARPGPLLPVLPRPHAGGGREVDLVHGVDRPRRFAHPLRYPPGGRDARTTTQFVTEVPTFAAIDELARDLEAKGSKSAPTRPTRDSPSSRRCSSRWCPPC